MKGLRQIFVSFSDSADAFETRVILEFQKKALDFNLLCRMISSETTPEKSQQHLSESDFFAGFFLGGLAPHQKQEVVLALKLKKPVFLFFQTEKGKTFRLQGKFNSPHEYFISESAPDLKAFFEALTLMSQMELKPKSEMGLQEIQKDFKPSSMLAGALLSYVFSEIMEE